MKFDFNSHEFEMEVWHPSHGFIGEWIAFDSETEMIEDGKIRDFVLGQAYSKGQKVYLITKPELKSFFNGRLQP